MLRALNAAGGMPSVGRMCEMHPSGPMGTGGKRAMARLLRHCQTKGAAPDRPSLQYRAPL